MYRLKLKVNNSFKTVDFEKPTALKDILINNDIPFELPCAGSGRCGKCKIKIHGDISEISAKEKEYLDDQEILEETRLACQVMLNGNAEAFINSSNYFIEEARGINKASSNYGLAIDIGTTTLCVALYDFEASEVIKKIQVKNPQREYGLDVISRIDYAINSDRTKLKDSIINGINSVLDTINEKIIENVKSVVITGNTAMLYLITGTDATPLSKAPFVIAEKFGKYLSADKLGIKIPKSCTAYIPPCISAFIGADLTCGVISSGLLEKKVAMLADIGTNGEIILKAGDKLYCCSTSVGPVFEGVGISNGMMAQDGAIESVYLKNGMIQTSSIGNGKQNGICGSGIIDALSVFKKLGIINKTGEINNIGSIYSEFIEDGKEIKISGDIKITQDDIRNVQLAKAAIYSGICTLVKESGISFDDIETLFVAGGFGEHINFENAAEIKMIPSCLSKKAKATGNSALNGAIMLLKDKTLIDNIEKLLKDTITISLPDIEFFKTEYIDAINF